MMENKKDYYSCPMHPEVMEENPGRCPKCGMRLEKTQKLTTTKFSHSIENHENHGESNKGSSSSHEMMDVSKMTFWRKIKMGLTMTMGMEHGGIAGREMAKLMEEDIRNKFFFSLLLTLPIIAYSALGENIFKLNLPKPFPVNWILLILTTPVFFYGGWIFLYSSYKALINRTLNMAVLIAVGIIAAYAFSIVLTISGSVDSYYEAAAMLITFVLFGHWMEMKSRRGTTDALQALFALVPPQARVFRLGKEELIATSDVKIDDILILKPGDKVPVDGVVTEGETSVDESLITGESIPVEKIIGSNVTGGSINGNGFIKFKATKVGKDTVLAQIVNMVETAQNSKAPGQKLADKFAQYLVIVAVGGGLLTFLVWFFILGEPLMFALTFAISAVVIACPDALGLATPTAVAVGTSLGAKHNILIKDAPTLEQVSKIQVVVLDKTGTLTDGKPVVTNVLGLNGYSEEEVLRLTASAESRSAHPLSKSIINESKKRGIKLSENVEKFVSLSGQGVEAFVEGKHVLVGTAKLHQERNVDFSQFRKTMDTLLSDGKTIMLLAIDGKASGVIAAADPVKESAKKAVTKIKELGLEVAMITGDNVRTAEAVGKVLGIERVFADVLPQDKANYVKKLQDEGKFVAMVGDGVNDAPALAQSDIGIAIGAGTDVAVETAKVVLMKSDPLDILRAIKLSKATVTKMKQNLFWASVYNLLAIPIAAGILYPKFGISLRPEVAALLMSISSIIVATNAILLKNVEKDLVKV